MTESFNISDIFSYAGGDLAACPGAETDWEASMESFPLDGIPFLREDAWSLARRQVGLPPEADEGLGRSAAIIRSDPRLSRLLWHIFRRYTWPLDVIKGAQSNWPEPVQLGEDRGMFYLLAALGFVPLVWKYHASMNIPEEVTLDTLKKFREHTILIYKEDNGRMGLSSGRLNWLSHFTHEPLFRLGRLEYWLRKSAYNYTVYRNRIDGTCVAFPAAGVKFTDEGLHLTPHEPENTPSWESEYVDDGITVSGTPYLPTGYASRKKLTLPRSEWELVYKPGDYMANMHIPYGGGMTPDVCRDSLSRVAPFFAKYFPETPVRMIITSSWIFGNQLEQVLAPDANLLNFQHNLYLVPWASGPEEGLGFIYPKVFGAKFDVKAVPRNTDLRRRVAEFIEAGGRWRTGGMFYMPEDIESYGTCNYLRKWQMHGF